MLWRFAIFSFYPLVTFSPVFMYIQQSDQKLWAFCHIYQVVFNIFNFCEKALISNCSNLWQFFVEIFTIGHVDVYSVCLLSEKKVHDCLFFLINDRHRKYICIIRIQLYWRCPVRSFLLMMICGWITLTSQCPLENDHKRQQICQIRYEKCWLVCPVFQVRLFYTS